MRNSTLVQLRWWQLRKECKGIGLVYVLVLLLLVLVASVGIYGVYHKSLRYALLASGLICLAMLGLHISRSDKAFVKRHMEGGARNMMVEYVVLTLPFTLPVLLTAQWWLFVLMQVFFGLITRIKAKPKQQVWFGFLSSWIAPRDYEWLSGVRKNFLVILVFYIAAWGLCWLRVAPLVGLWVITVSIASFYMECEPLHLLKAGDQNPAVMLKSKIRRHCGLLVLISAPLLLVNTLFCPEMLWINLAFSVAQCALLSFALLLKYSTYRPGELLSGNNLLLGIMALSVLIPFLLPLPLLMNIRNYRRAVANLKSYYHDQHATS